MEGGKEGRKRGWVVGDDGQSQKKGRKEEREGRKEG